MARLSKHIFHFGNRAKGRRVLVTFMTSEEKKTYARRITEANATELIVVLYDMLIGDLTKAADVFQAPEPGEETGKPKGILTIVRTTDSAVEDLRHAEQVVDQLRSVLSFKGEAAEMSRNLYSLYDYMLRCIAKGIYLQKAEPVNDALHIAQSLREAFAAVAEQDDSAPLMKNTESTVAGMTYGRAGLSEVSGDYTNNRGFFV